MGALAVIYVHCAGIFLWQYGTGTLWDIANVLNAASRFCVPMFIMASGALLVGRPIENGAAYLQHRVLTIAKPYAFGAVFYLIWGTYYQHTPPASAFSYVKSLLYGQPYFHLYFLAVMLGIYLVSPLFQGLSRENGRPVVWSLVALFCLFGIQRYLTQLDITFGLFPPVTKYLLYFPAGFALAKVVKIRRRTAALTYVGATAATVMLVWIASTWAGKRAGLVFEEYDSPTVIIQSLALFAFLQGVRVPAVLCGVVSATARLTLGIYILHFSVMTMLMDLIYHTISASPITIVLLVPPVTFLAAAGATRMLHFIPGLRGFV